MDIILERILKLMSGQNLSARQFTADLFLNRNVVNDWKSGKSSSYRKYVYEIARYFGVSPLYLRGEIDTPEPFEVPHDPNFKPEEYIASAEIIQEEKDGLPEIIGARYLKVPENLTSEQIDRINEYMKFLAYQNKGKE